MIARIRRWLALPQLKESVEQEQAGLVQALLLALFFLTLPGMALPFFAPIAPSQALGVTLVVALGPIIAVTGLALLRRGQFQTAILLTCLGLILLLGGVLLTTGVGNSGAAIFGFALPIVLSGLLSGWRTMSLVLVASIGAMSLSMILEQMGVAFIGFAAPRGDNPAGIIGGFLVIALILGIFVTRFGKALHTSLHESHQREQNLAALRDSLEQTIAEQTADLRQALIDAENQAAEQKRLLEENRHQRQALQELSVPLLPVDRQTLVLPLIGNLDDERMQALFDRALGAAERSTIRRLIIDISGVPLIDTQVARGLTQVVRALNLLGTEAIIVGVRPEVAETIVSLGLQFGEVRIFRDLEAAISERNQPASSTETSS
jgi:rsbT co-antagonist protein RsbR